MEEENLASVSEFCMFTTSSSFVLFRIVMSHFSFLSSNSQALLVQSSFVKYAAMACTEMQCPGNGGVEQL